MTEPTHCWSTLKCAGERIERGTGTCGKAQGEDAPFGNPLSARPVLIAVQGEIEVVEVEVAGRAVAVEYGKRDRERLHEDNGLDGGEQLSSEVIG
jgi:hypothetical protein